MNELVKRLRDAAKMSEALAVLLPHSEGNATAKLYNEAADAIEELLQKTQQLPRWIPVTEALPEPYTWVLVSAEKHEVAFDAFYDGAHWKDAVLNGLIVTHWMPLPEPPKEET